MPDSNPGVNRRQLLATSMAAAAGLWLPLAARAQAPDGGTTLVIGPGAELTSPLVAAVTTAGISQIVSSKMFDGLMTYDAQLRPQPRLATEWHLSADGLSLTLQLRRGVGWHDGQPFTSADVQFSLLEVWRKYHARGRSTFASVDAVETPDPHTAVIRLSRPTPYLLLALASPVEAQVIPRHIYGTGDVLANPALYQPVGNGPFRFVRWDRGHQIILERNPHYWQAGMPRLDRVIFRFLPDAAANVAALETGSVHVTSAAPLSDLRRLEENPALHVRRSAASYSRGYSALGFNLDRPQLTDVRVRQAFAHAIDRDFIARNIYHGWAHPVFSPIEWESGQYEVPDIVRYPFDLKRAEALLEEAGLQRARDGVRLRLNVDPNGPILLLVAQYLRANLARIGVALTIRTQDFGEFVNRIYTRRDFDLVLENGTSGPDPAIAVQRLYWSKSFQPGVAFSNSAHYASPEADSLLERGQVESDAQRRRDLYVQFQRVVMADLPRIPLVAMHAPLAYSQRVQALPDIDPLHSNLAHVSLSTPQ